MRHVEKIIPEMAKLSARGRMELFRVSQERQESGESLTWSKKTYVFMSDGNILEKNQVRFKPDQYHPEGRLYDWGWKMTGRKFNPQEVEELRRIMLAKGFKEERSR